VGGSELLFGMRSHATNLIFSDAAVWTMTHVGGEGVFAFSQVAAGASGIMAPRCAADVDGTAYWMGKNDFYMFDGTVRRIPRSKEIRRFVFDALTTLQESKCFCGINTLFSEIWWFYTTGTEIDRYVKYNYDDKAWDVGTLARTAMSDKGVIAYPLMISTDRRLYQHESGNDDMSTGTVTSTMADFIDSAPWDLDQGNREMDINRFDPDLKNVTGTVTISLLTRDSAQGTQTEENATEVTGTSGFIDVRASGRQAAQRIKSKGIGSHWRLGEFRFDVSPGGSR